MPVQLRKVRLSFPDLWEAKAFRDGKPSFGATFLIPKSDKNTIAAIENAILKAAEAKFGAKAKQIVDMVRTDHKAFLFQDGDHARYADYEGYAGHMVLRAKSRTRPQIVDRDGKTPLTEADGRPYSGCNVNALVDPFAFAGDNKGVSFQLMAVVFHSDNDAFGGGRPASESELADLAVGDEGMEALA